MTKRTTILVLGGYGVFGGRISRRLATDKGLRVVVAGRSRIKAGKLAEEIKAGNCAADVVPLGLTVPGDLAAAIDQVGADLVIHACGPFQGQNYDVPRICIEAGIHYIDLADGREFVDGFAQLDGAAADNGVMAVTGASSVPGLSTAVIADLARDMTSVRTIEIAIAPGNRTERGPAVFAGILSYTGRPIPRLQDGQWGHAHGWQDLRKRRIGAPGLGSLGRRWLSACDVPDLALLPIRYPDLERVTFHAGHELPFAHLGLWGASWLVRGGLIPSLEPFHRVLHRAEQALAGAGSDTGGMDITVTGEDAQGAALSRTWTLLAWDGHGPWVPCLPAIVLARKIARGRLDRRGALPCVELFTLKEFEREAADFSIASKTVTNSQPATETGSAHHGTRLASLRRRLGQRFRPAA